MIFCCRVNRAWRGTTLNTSWYYIQQMQYQPLPQRQNRNSGSQAFCDFLTCRSVCRREFPIRVMETTGKLFKSSKLNTPSLPPFPLLTSFTPTIQLHTHTHTPAQVVSAFFFHPFSSALSVSPAKSSSNLSSHLAPQTKLQLPHHILHFISLNFIMIRWAVMMTVTHISTNNF